MENDKTKKYLMISILIAVIINMFSYVNHSAKLVGWNLSFLIIDAFIVMVICLGMLYMLKKYKKKYLKLSILSIAGYFISNFIIYFWYNAINIKVKLSDLFLVHGIDSDMVMGVLNFVDNISNAVLFGLSNARGFILLFAFFVSIFGLAQYYKEKNQDR